MLDFSKVIDRRGTDSYKWDGSDRELGNTECIQMGCADMDFETAPELVDALRAVVEHKVYGYATLSPEFACATMLSSSQSGLCTRRVS